MSKVPAFIGDMVGTGFILAPSQPLSITIGGLQWAQHGAQISPHTGPGHALVLKMGTVIATDPLVQFDGVSFAYIQDELTSCGCPITANPGVIPPETRSLFQIGP